METLFSENTVAMLAVVMAAMSEVIGMSKAKSNSVIQLTITIIKRLFGLK